MRDEIDFLELIRAVWRRRIIVIIVAVVAVILSSVVSFGFMDDEYLAKTSLYVLNQSDNENITNSDLTASASLVNDYREIIMSNKVTQRVLEELNLEDLKAFDIAVASKNNTRLIEIRVTGKDAYLAAAVSNGLANAFSQAVVEIMRVDNVSIIDPAVIPEEPSGPARERMILLVTAAAVVMTMMIFMIMELFNTSLKTVEDVEKQTGMAVLGQFSQFSENKTIRR